MACSNRPSYTQAYTQAYAQPLQQAQLQQLPVQQGVQQFQTQQLPAQQVTQQLPAQSIQQQLPVQQTTQQAAGTGYVEQGEWGQTMAVDPVAIPGSPAAVTAMPPPVVPSPSMLPETLSEYIYTPGYLRANIGALMRVEFLIGNNITDRVGYLREVGASYIVLDALNSASKMMCDIYSIRFITILEGNQERDRTLIGAF